MEWFGVGGLEAAVVMPFTLELARLSPEDFVVEILVRDLQVRAVLVGENFRFGHRQAGDVKLLRELGMRHGFDVVVIPPVILPRRDRLQHRDTKSHLRLATSRHAARLLGRPFVLTGEVVSGTGTGRRFTFPTLNLAPEQELLPARGVYVTRTLLEGETKSRRSVTNIGMRPDVQRFDAHCRNSFAGLFRRSPQPNASKFTSGSACARKKSSAGPKNLRAQIAKDIASATRFFSRLRRFAPSGNPLRSHRHSCLRVTRRDPQLPRTPRQ